MARGRRVNSSGEKSKKLLLEKALELFSTYGYHETKISDIVKAAEVTQPTFYLYFQSKESLYQDLNREFQEQFFSIMDHCLEVTQHYSDKEIIHNLLKTIFEYFVENPYITKIGFFNSEESLLVKESFAQKLCNFFDDKQIRSRFDGVEPHIFANSFIGSIERLTLMVLFTGERSPEQLASDIMNMYFVHERELVG